MVGHNACRRDDARRWFRYAVGFVTPFGSVQSIQHLEGGIIAEILVRDGALVEAGKVLVRLDPTAALAELDSKETRLVALMLQANRLRAFAKERQPEYGNIPKKYKELIEDQLVILQLQEQARRGQRRVIHHQIEQRRAELRVLREEGLMLKERIAIATQMLEMRGRSCSRKGSSHASFISIPSRS